MTQERFTVLASTAVAIAMLGAAVTAQPSRSTPKNRLERLESDLRYQLELEARVDPPAYAARTKALDAVLEAWRQSPQSASDYQLMAAWLQQSLSRSLPGGSDQWPAAPTFTAAKHVEHVARKEIAAEPRVDDSPAIKLADSPPEPRAAKPRAAAKPGALEPIIAHVSDPVPIGVARAEEPSDPRPAPTAVQTAEVYREPAVKKDVAKPTATADLRRAAEAAVRVNLAELSARIGGYHDGLREVEAAVVAGRQGMTLGQVTELVVRLETLAAQQKFVRLYYDSLTPGERDRVTAPRSMVGTIELVQQQRSRVEAAREEDHFSTAGGVRTTELSRRLRALVEAAGE